jgi:nucleotide-binding universal stress UspA family protein
VVGGRPAVLLHVWNPPERVIADAFGVREDDHGPTVEQLEELVKDRAREILVEGQTLARQLGLTVTPRAERNDSTVWKTILDVADELDADLIVTGTHGSTVVESGLLGSVSNALLHNAHRPVLVVPNQDAKPS